MTVIIGGLVLVWIALTGSLDPVSLGVGTAVAASVAFAQRRLFPTVHAHDASTLLRRPHRLIAYLATLGARLTVSTVRTCWLILFGKPEGLVVALPIRLKAPLAQFLLLHSITMIPSTISLLLEEDLLYIHWLQAAGRREDWQGIKEALEARLYAAFDEVEDAHR